MLTYCVYTPPFNICSSISCSQRRQQVILKISRRIHVGSFFLASKRRTVATALMTTALALMLSSMVVSVTMDTDAADLLGEQDSETLSNIPQELSSDCPADQNCKKLRIQRPKSRKAESCTSKCVTTCIQGGYGSPGEGPLNVRRPLVVFKDGFRSRRYCLVECSDICNLIGDGDDGP